MNSINFVSQTIFILYTSKTIAGVSHLKHSQWILQLSTQWSILISNLNVIGLNPIVGLHEYILLLTSSNGILF